MKLSKRHSSLAILFAYLICLVAAYLALRPGLGIDFHFDSFPNLRPLDNVYDFESALLFVFSGDSGPLGRPIALASFLINAGAWPDDPAPFLYVNLLVHLFNGLLLFAFAYVISQRLQLSLHRSLIAASLASILWLAAPILLSTTFSVIQRMTSLAGMFMLLGLIGHVLITGFSNWSDRRRLGLLTLNLGVFTALAAFCKENGLLLPVLILVLEGMVLGSAGWHQARLWQMWKALFLWLPLILIVGYLVSRFGYADSTVVYRGFTALERLLTQAVILWEYLWHAFLPATRNVGFFHDNYTAVKELWSPKALTAIGAWLATIGVALAVRKRWPLLTFAVFWYLGGHLLESTTVPLELYFEHRNYVPLMGPLVAFAIGVTSLKRSTARTALLASSLYFVMMLVVSGLTTSLWASKMDAADFWLETKPNSERAVSYYVRQQVAANNPLAALGALEFAKADIDAEPYFSISQLWIQCQFDTLGGFRMNFSEIQELLPGAKFRFGVVAMLGQLYGLLDRPQCDNLSKEDLLDAALALLRNERYAKIPMAQFGLNRIAANALYDQGEKRRSIDHYERAVQAQINVPITIRLNRLYQEFGLWARGCRFYEGLIETAPMQPFIRYRWVGNVRTQMRSLGRASPFGDCKLLPEQ